MRRLEGLALGYWFIVLAVAWYRNEKDFLVGVIVGGLIALPNFRLWQWLVQVLVQERQAGYEKKRFRTIVKIILKYSFPFVAVPVAILYFDVDVLGLTAGLSAIVASIMLYAFWLIFQVLFSNQKTNQDVS